MQLLNPKDEECNSWLMILENIIVMVDKEKMEKVTGGEWRACIGRCLYSLLAGCKSGMS
jgi:nucleolar pre-ribosomal-associated protein 1